MTITRIQGKKLLAQLGETESIDEKVVRKILDLCRRRDIHKVSLVYPFRRLDELRPFMSDVTRITGRPVMGFSHDSHDIAPERVH